MTESETDTTKLDSYSPSVISRSDNQEARLTIPQNVTGQIQAPLRQFLLANPGIIQTPIVMGVKTRGIKHCQAFSGLD
jgi:hypothetical protein